MWLKKIGTQVLKKHRTKTTHGKRANIHVKGGTGALEKEEIKHNVLRETDIRLSQMH